VGVQEVKWDREGSKPADEYKFCNGKGNENHELGTSFFVHKRNISAVTGVQFVSDRMYIILIGVRCDITVLNVHARTEDNTDDMKGRFYEEPEHEIDKFSKYHMKFLLRDLNSKVSREDIFKPNLGIWFTRNY
jgi:hypothetical protein